jgi:tungstate transport system substrate-binding protein
MMNKKRFVSRFLAAVIAVILITSANNAMAGEKSLMMATTTSTDNTGLLDYLIPYFEKQTGIALKWTATGTGKGLKQ